MMEIQEMSRSGHNHMLHIDRDSKQLPARKACKSPPLPHVSRNQEKMETRDGLDCLEED